MWTKVSQGDNLEILNPPYQTDFIFLNFFIVNSLLLLLRQLIALILEEMISTHFIYIVWIDFYFWPPTIVINNFAFSKSVLPTSSYLEMLMSLLGSSLPVGYSLWIHFMAQSTMEDLYVHTIKWFGKLLYLKRLRCSCGLCFEIDSILLKFWWKKGGK